MKSKKAIKREVITTAPAGRATSHTPKEPLAELFILGADFPRRGGLHQAQADGVKRLEINNIEAKKGSLKEISNNNLKGCDYDCNNCNEQCSEHIPVYGVW